MEKLQRYQQVIQFITIMLEPMTQFNSAKMPLTMRWIVVMQQLVLQCDVGFLSESIE